METKKKEEKEYIRTEDKLVEGEITEERFGVEKDKHNNIAVHKQLKPD